MLPATTRTAALAARQLALARSSSSPATPSAVLRALAASLQQQPWSMTVTRGYATPAGPPPKGFRVQRPKEWDEESEGTMTKVSNYFLLTEMFRGMYVLMEQFFRPPYVFPRPHRLHPDDC